MLGDGDRFPFRFPILSIVSTTGTERVTGESPSKQSGEGE
jgi:hypothetical protein